MKIKLLEDMKHPDPVQGKKGDVVEVADHLGHHLDQHGFAEIVEDDEDFAIDQDDDTSDPLGDEDGDPEKETPEGETTEAPEGAPGEAKPAKAQKPAHKKSRSHKA